MSTEKVSYRTDHDILIGLDIKMDILSTNFTNHLHHHFLYTIALFTALLSLIGGVIILILKT